MVTGFDFASGSPHDRDRCIVLGHLPVVESGSCVDHGRFRSHGGCDADMAG